MSTRDKRRTIERYSENGEAQYVIKQLCPNTARLLGWFESYLKPTERITVEHWTGDVFYIVIDDTAMHNEREYEQASINAMRCGVTVNVKDDAVMYSNDTKVNPHGGNCFVRANKWKKFIKLHFGQHYLNGGFHIYKDGRKKVTA